MKGLLPSDHHPLPSRTPQQMFDEALSDKDYSKNACLQTYSSKTILLSGPEAGQERREPPVPPHEESSCCGAIRKCLNAFVGRLGRKRESTAKKLVDRSIRTPSYITGGITWVEPGLWNGKEAHFVLLHFEHRRGAENYLEQVELDLRVWRAGDAIQSMAEHSHEPLIEVSPPFAEHLADHAPPIALYAPRAVVGRPADSHIEPYWRGKFRRGDDIRYAGDLHSPREGTLGGPKPSDPRCLLHIVAYGDLDHSVPAPDFSVALVVLSDGKPFDLTVFDMTYHWNLAPIRQYLWSPYKPAKFTSAAQLRPKGQKPILCDFASEEMKARIKELVHWCQPYDTLWFGNELGCVGRTPEDPRGCSRRTCTRCQGRF